MINQTSSHGTHNILGICSKTKSRDDESSVFFHEICIVDVWVRLIIEMV